MKKADDLPTSEVTGEEALKRMQELTRKIIAVPKTELDKRKPKPA